MAFDELYYQPNGQAFSGKQPMKSVDKLSYLNSIEDCYRYGGDRAIGPYYPARPLPGFEIDMDAEWPIVMPAGTIVSIIPIKDVNAYVSGDLAETGIDTDGAIYVTMGVDGTALQRSINLVYPKETAGLITVCNGGTATTDSYSDNDGTYGMLSISGEIVDSDDSYTRSANVPIGIVNSRVYADMRWRYLNYDVGQEPTSVALGGVLTIPYVAVYGGSANDRSTVITAIRAAVKAKHQYYWMNVADSDTADTNLAVDTRLKSDTHGKFTVYSSDSHDSNQEFGRVLELRNRVPYDLDELIDSFPGSGMKGMDTGGLSARYYNFAKTILALSAVKGSTYAANKDNIKSTLYEAVATETSASVYVKMGQVDVAFGKVNY